MISCTKQADIQNEIQADYKNIEYVKTCQFINLAASLTSPGLKPSRHFRLLKDGKDYRALAVIIYQIVDEYKMKIDVMHGHEHEDGTIHLSSGDCRVNGLCRNSFTHPFAEGDTVTKWSIKHPDGSLTWLGDSAWVNHWNY